MNRNLLPPRIDYLKPQLVDGRARTEYDRVSIDLIHAHERLQYLKGKEEKQQVCQNDYTHLREMKRAVRKLKKAERSFIACMEKRQ